MLGSAKILRLVSSYYRFTNCPIISNRKTGRLKPRAAEHSSIDNPTVIALAVLCGVLGLMLLCWTGWYFFRKSTCKIKSPILEEENELESWDPGDFVYADQDWPQQVTDLTLSPSPLPLHRAPAPYPRRSSYLAPPRWSLSTESLDIASLRDSQRPHALGDTASFVYPSLHEEYDDERYYHHHYQPRVPEVPRRNPNLSKRRRSHQSRTILPTISEMDAFDFGFSRMPAARYVPDSARCSPHMLRQAGTCSDITRIMRPPSRLQMTR